MLYQAIQKDIGGFSAYMPNKKNIWPAVIAAVGSLASGIIGNVMSRDNAEDAQEHSEEFAREQYAKQAAREDALNANSALIARQSAERAGMNLNAGLYNQLSSNVTPASPQMQPAQTMPFDFSAVAQLAQNQPLVDAEVKKKEAEKTLIEKQAGVADADIILKQAQTWNIEQMTPAQRENIEKNTAEMVQHIENMKVEKELVNATIGKVLAETAGQELQNYLTQESTPLILQQYASNIALLNAQKDLTDAQTAAAYKSLQVMAAQINALNSQANYNNAQAKYVATAMVGLAIDNDVKKYRAAFTSEYVHKELKMSDAQIKQAENAAEQMRVNTEFAPLQAIAGAGASVGVAFGGVATGLNQGAQFLNQKPARPIGFGR